MADEPNLPQLPRLASNPAALILGYGRKRARGGNATYAPPHVLSSSDPAVFSSDDDAGLDNYVDGRRKKRYVGTWYDQHPVSSTSSDSALSVEWAAPPLPAHKREFRRQLDSGVWLEQDAGKLSTAGGSINDDDLVSDAKSGDSTDSAYSADSGDLEDFWFEGDAEILRAFAKNVLPPANRTKLSVEEQAAKEIIDECVESGNTIVQLSDLGLHVISNEVLERISAITPIPNVDVGVEFEYHEPSIEVYMANNSIREFPGAILGVEFLTVLSLRGNKLRELPSSIASLKNLKELNIGQNLLRYLPGELLDILGVKMAFEKFTVYPNPFYMPKDWRSQAYTTLGPIEALEGSEENRARQEYESGTFGRNVMGTDCCRTPVQVNDGVRRPISEFRLPALHGPHDPPDQDLAKHESGVYLERESFWELALPTKISYQPRLPEDGQGPPRPKGAPSLMELALRAAVHSDRVDDLVLMVNRGDLVADHLTRSFNRAVEVAKMGGQKCCVCGRETLTPATEWIEFRMGGRGDDMLPFMRRGCSLACLPYKAASPPPTFFDQRLAIQSAMDDTHGIEYPREFVW
ncbi:hypothetical protein B0T24DRAFT_683909 [Lasiosphaeria ovina]|uniref:Leucine rich repeat domain protein n=1 Tax=Lasiosphaeria ovina TaxID=92902 RepID=A0AAE0JVY7_9PEZI|nr:hypothetical protein B0T24DRAFT_683909 [Lasiosphaeria ovina]